MRFLIFQVTNDLNEGTRNFMNVFWLILNHICLVLRSSGRGIFVWRIGLFLNSTYYAKLNTIL